MDLSVVLGILQGLSQTPYVGKPILILLGLYAGVVGVSASLGAVATAIVTLWQGLQKSCLALSLVPGLAFLAKPAAAMQMEAQALDDFEKGKLLPLLSRLSALPLPVKASVSTPPTA